MPKVPVQSTKKNFVEMNKKFVAMKSKDPKKIFNQTHTTMPGFGSLKKPLGVENIGFTPVPNEKELS